MKTKEPHAKSPQLDSGESDQTGEEMGAERRVSSRKIVDTIHVCDLTSTNTYTVIASDGYIVDASALGFLLQLSRKDLLSKDLKENLTLDSLVGQNVVLYLPEMNLGLDGTISRTAHTGKGIFEIAVEFSDDIPDYWRECLVDLLPKPGELD